MQHDGSFHGREVACGGGNGAARADARRQESEYVHMQPTFVLVHGAFANSFSFAPLQAELGLLGHRSVAVDLPGHGFGATYVRSYQAPQDLHPFDVRTLEGSHLKWLTDPAPAARVLAELAELMVKGARRG